MSARCIDFLQKWVEGNVPFYPKGDPEVAAKLAEQAMADAMTADAGKAGIRPEEISEEVGSILTMLCLKSSITRH